MQRELVRCGDDYDYIIFQRRNKIKPVNLAGISPLIKLQLWGGAFLFFSVAFFFLVGSWKPPPEVGR